MDFELTELTQSRHRPTPPTPEAAGLECLRCRHTFLAHEVESARAAERGYVECPWCDGRNELRRISLPGFGGRARNVVIGILDDR